MARCSPAELLRQYWGYDTFLPHQEEAILSALAGRSSLVVMPTGGGKSVCYQIPALLRDGLTIVVSPLISLMKDQVDALRTCGIPAAALNSSLAASRQQEVLRDAASGRIRLLYVAPERLLTDQLLGFLEDHSPAGFAVDEAHCISTWGHDFRPEYRLLRRVREQFADRPWQALTATATPAVREDIVAQLGLSAPDVFVGSFHRPNLVYHVARRTSGWNQVCEVMETHRNEAGIIYAIARSRVEQLSDTLNRLGFRTQPYHAGLTDQQRARNQEALIQDEIDAIVATVAFGMGIDKPNVRYVIHAEMPKSIESYQQESGRAGRDGLDADCWLFYSAQDYQVWQRIIDAGGEEDRARAEKALHDVHAYCHSVACRHKYLVEYFGQTLDTTCTSCDVCRGGLTRVSDPLRVGQMILSCVLRCREQFGADHISKVLTGSQEARVLQFGHHELSTWGLLKETPRRQVRDWIDQLLAQQYLAKVGEYSVLKVTDTGWQLLRGQAEPVLMQTVRPMAAVTPSRIFDSWEGVDRELFERLRMLRRELAAEANVAAFIIFSDATLRDVARRRPTTAEFLLSVHGIGQRKAADYGPRVLELIGQWCAEKGVDGNVEYQGEGTSRSRERDRKTPSAGALASFELFDRGLSLQEVAQQMGRAQSTVGDYLEQYVATRGITDPTRWVDPHTAQRIEAAAAYNDTGRLKPLFDALHGQVGYDVIRVVLACLGNRQGQ